MEKDEKNILDWIGFPYRTMIGSEVNKSIVKRDTSFIKVGVLIIVDIIILMLVYSLFVNR